MIRDGFRCQRSEVGFVTVVKRLSAVLPRIVVSTEEVCEVGFLKFISGSFHEDEVESGARLSGVQKVRNVVIGNVDGIARVPNIAMQCNREERNRFIFKAGALRVNREVDQKIGIRNHVHITIIEHILSRGKSRNLFYLQIHICLTADALSRMIIGTEFVTD